MGVETMIEFIVKGERSDMIRFMAELRDEEFPTNVGMTRRPCLGRGQPAIQ